MEDGGKEDGGLEDGEGKMEEGRNKAGSQRKLPERKGQGGDLTSHISHLTFHPFSLFTFHLSLPLYRLHRLNFSNDKAGDR